MHGNKGFVNSEPSNETLSHPRKQASLCCVSGLAPKEDRKCPASLSQICQLVKRELVLPGVERSRGIIPAKLCLCRKKHQEGRRIPTTHPASWNMLLVCLGRSLSGAFIIPALLYFLLGPPQTGRSHLNKSSFRTSLVLTQGIFFAWAECFSLLFLPSDPYAKIKLNSHPPWSASWSARWPG